MAEPPGAPPGGIGEAGISGADPVGAGEGQTIWGPPPSGDPPDPLPVLLIIGPPLNGMY